MKKNFTVLVAIAFLSLSLLYTTPVLGVIRGESWDTDYGPHRRLV